MALIPSMGVAQQSDKDAFEEIRRIRDNIAQQRRVLEQQQQQLRRLEEGLLSGGRLTPEQIGELRGRGAGDAQVAQGTGQPVGQAPEARRPEVAVLPEAGGVLTPRGQLVFEPQLEYSHSSTQRFFFSGVQIVDAVLIGAIEAEDARRDSFTTALAARYGITDRFEADVRVPFVYRDDIENDPLDPDSGLERELTGKGLGDIEVGLHYQLNDGAGGSPYYIANLRGKLTTGEGPFDVDFDADGRQRELPTGSGFYSLEPSITVLYPTDPVVLFGNIGYAFNLPDDVDKTIGGDLFGEVDPGDSIAVSFGMGFGLSPQTSFSLGYEHNYVLPTDTEVNGATAESDELQVGSFLVGFNYRNSERVSTAVNLAIGATEDAPDVRIGLRTAIAFDLFR